MSKAVLISIQPKWCELIASGKKTVEVRKTRPKKGTPFKVYIYQTRRTWIYDIYSRIADWQGKVIGEFVCYQVDRIAHCGTCNRDIRLNLVDKNFYCKELDYEYLNKCELSYFDIYEYSNGGDVYGWHISNLKIYDEPKELSEFIKPCYTPFQCDKCDNLVEHFGCGRTITRPPQSWCYVEVEPNLDDLLY